MQIAVIGLLALSSYFVYDHEKNVPSETTDEWMAHVTALVPLTLIFSIASIYGIWVILTDQRRYFFIAVKF